MSANIIISNDSMNNSSRILASKSNENGLSTIFSYNGNDITFKTENGITYVNATFAFTVMCLISVKYLYLRQSESQ